MALAGGVAYPFLVYFGLTVVKPTALVMVGLALAAVRMLSSRGLARSRDRSIVFALAGLALLGLLLLSPQLAAKAYPVAMSLAAGAVFGISLRFPPTVVEQLARLTEPDLPAEGVAYTRKVTWVWMIFLICNACIAAATGLWGSLAQWTLWNGLLSYIAMGLLFGGEFLIRHRVRRRGMLS